jgi:ABC-type glycerol-3-phosphate transport system substrate-binding protein
MLTVHPAMKLTLEIAATVVAAAVLAGCGGDGSDDAVTKRTQAELGDTFVVHSCTATGEERDDLRWYYRVVFIPD